MATPDDFTAEENEVLERWYVHARQWGYKTPEPGSTEMHSRFEERLHDEVSAGGFYRHLTGLSDVVFRNLINYAREEVMRRSDLYAKAGDADLARDDAEQLCARGSPVRKLLRDYFATVPDFVNDLVEIRRPDRYSHPAYALIVNCALALYAIAFLEPSDVRTLAKRILRIREPEDDDDE